MSGLEVTRVDGGAEGEDGTVGRRIFKVAMGLKASRRPVADSGASGNSPPRAAKSGSTGVRSPVDVEAPSEAFSARDREDSGMDADLAQLGNPNSQVARSGAVTEPPLDLGIAEIDIITGMPIQTSSRQSSGRVGKGGGPGRGAQQGASAEDLEARRLSLGDGESDGRVTGSKGTQKCGTKDSSVVRREIDEW